MILAEGEDAGALKGAAPAQAQKAAESAPPAAQPAGEIARAPTPPQPQAPAAPEPQAEIEPEVPEGTEMVTMTVREALRDAMAEEMRRDETVFVIGEEVAEYQGAYKVTQGLLQEFGERRVIDTPITEHGFAGLGVGTALAGLKPIVEFMTFNFAMQAMDQIINSATMQQIVEDVANQTDKRLALVVATHRHQDHISGFGRYEREFKQIGV
jgi:pyruvate dehydrogenase E1 component beta subunit